MCIGEWVEKRASLHPDEPAIISDDGRVFTYSEFSQRVNRLANALPAIGITKGERIAVLFPNNPEFLEVLFAAAKIGAIAVPLNFRLASPELSYILNDCTASVLAYTPEFEEKVKVVKGADGGKNIKKFIRVGEGAGEDEIDYEGLLSSFPDSSPGLKEQIVDDDPHMLVYTSGTTGRPKGAILTHDNTHWNAINAVLRYMLSRKDTNLGAAPLYHIGGLSAGAVPTIFTGGKVVLCRFFDPDQVLKMIESHKVTTMFGIPSMFLMMSESEQFEKTDFSSVRFFIAGGAPCPVSLIERYLGQGVTFAQGYGLTEAAPGVTALLEEDALRKRGSSGQALFYVEIDIFDENNMELPTGEVGEIVVRGPNVFKGYWNKPEETEEALKYDWLHTGDIGYLDQEGFLYVTDRKKDMMISGGENIYPIEVENVLRAHPKVADVGVIGMPDAKWGEAPLALVVVEPGEKLGEEELIEFCRDRLARYKVPKKTIFLDELPRNSIGKILKKELRAKYVDGL